MTGIVKWFNNEKGYGFIQHTEGNDIFVHYSMILSDGYKTLSEGDIVQFELIETDKGLQAIKVNKVGSKTTVQ
ncbi:MAG: cold shock domain-containing protein [Bacilli bacterium]|nr:cold shock domain-containing protein [Bacilli bacterium]